MPGTPTSLPARNPAWLAQRIAAGYTTAEIAELAGCTDRTVRSAIHRHGLPHPTSLRPPRSPGPAAAPRRSRFAQLNDADWLADRLDEGGTILGIAREVGCDRTAVRKALHRHGLTVTDGAVRAAQRRAGRATATARWSA